MKTENKNVNEAFSKAIQIESHFEQIHNIIDVHRSRALQTVNSESLLICWEIGKYVSTKIKNSEWGGKVVAQLSEYLRIKDPSLKGYSRRNIYNMVLFYETYSSQAFIKLTESTNIQNQLFESIKVIGNKPDIIVQFKTAQLQKSIQFPQILNLINWTNREIVRYALNRSLSPTMIAKYERELIPKEVLQQSLSEFLTFNIDNK